METIVLKSQDVNLDANKQIVRNHQELMVVQGGKVEQA